MSNAVFISSLIATLGIVYNTIELLLERDEILKRFFQWRIVRSRYYILLDRPFLSLLFDILCSHWVFMGIVVSHAVAAILFALLFFYNYPSLAAIAALLVVFGNCVINVRLLVGRDGADQFQNIIWTGLFAYCLPLEEFVKHAALFFVVAQLMLSYLVSGISKAASPVWRKGTALELISRMATYCPKGVSRNLSRPVVSKLTCWTTIAFEVLAPLLIFFGTPGVFIFISLGVMFHIGIALTMGLTTFVFAFLAAYPILFCLAT